MARTAILRADVVLSFSGVTLILFCFVFIFFAFAEAAALSSIVLRPSIWLPSNSHTQLPNNCLCSSFLFLPSFCFFGDVAFSAYLKSWVTKAPNGLHHSATPKSRSPAASAALVILVKTSLLPSAAFRPLYLHLPTCAILAASPPYCCGCKS